MPCVMLLLQIGTAGTFDPEDYRQSLADNMALQQQIKIKTHGSATEEGGRHIHCWGSTSTMHSAPFWGTRGCKWQQDAVAQFHVCLNLCSSITLSSSSCMYAWRLTECCLLQEVVAATAGAAAPLPRRVPTR